MSETKKNGHDRALASLKYTSVEIPNILQLLLAANSCNNINIIKGDVLKRNNFLTFPLEAHYTTQQFTYIFRLMPMAY